MKIRVWDQYGAVIRDFTSVKFTQLNDYGALTVVMDSPHEPSSVIINPRVWGVVEHLDRQPVPAGRHATAVAELPSRTPGQSLPVPGPDPLGLPDRMRVQQAIETHCTCARLRCTYRAGDNRQCCRDRAHAGPHDTQPPSRWVWGPSQHHPQCPRNPERYNAHIGPCGATADNGVTCVLPFNHAGDHAASISTDGALPAVVDDTATLQRVAAGLDGWDVPREDVTTPDDDAEAGYSVGRNRCTAMTVLPVPAGSGQPYERQQCSRPIGHEGLHCRWVDATPVYW